MKPQTFQDHWRTCPEPLPGKYSRTGYKKASHRLERRNLKNQMKLDFDFLLLPLKE
ncbi:MAG: hypothetical protein WCJ84_05540 [Candidatus Peregrinibacteria bacterium]